MSGAPTQRTRTGRFLTAAYEAHELSPLKRVRVLLRSHLFLHPRDPWGLAFAATVWIESKRPKAALRLAQRALNGLQAETHAGLRFALEGDILEAGVRAACHLRNQTPSLQQHDALGKTALTWLGRLVVLEPDSAATFLLEPDLLGSLREPLERLLRTRARTTNPGVGFEVRL